MIRTIQFSWVFLGLATLLIPIQANAQMFGVRQVGQPLQRQATPGSFQQLNPGQPAGAGATLTGGERFLRGARDAAAFVGADARESANFVGQVNAGDQSLNVQPAITAPIRPNLGGLINRPLRTRPANSLMEPVYVIAFELAPETIAQLDATAQKALDSALSSRFGNQIAVSVANSTATLLGEVPDAESSQLAELMCRMEPRISAVENRLTIRQEPGANR